MKYLTYLPGRRRPWTEHNCFPKGAVRVLRESPSWRTAGQQLLIFKLSEDRQAVTLVPEEEWEL